MTAVPGIKGLVVNPVVLPDEPVVMALRGHLRDKDDAAVSVVMQYQIDEFVREVKGDLNQLSSAKQAAVKAAAQGVTFLDLQEMVPAKADVRQLKEMFPNLQSLVVANEKSSWLTLQLKLFAKDPAILSQAAEGVTFLDLQEMTLSKADARQLKEMFPNLQSLVVANEKSSWLTLQLKLFAKDPSIFSQSDFDKITKISKRVKGILADFLECGQKAKQAEQKKITELLENVKNDDGQGKGYEHFREKFLEKFFNDIQQELARKHTLGVEDVRLNIIADIMEAKISMGMDLEHRLDEEMYRISLQIFAEDEREIIEEGMRKECDRCMKSCCIL